MDTFVQEQLAEPVIAGVMAPAVDTFMFSSWHCAFLGPMGACTFRTARCCGHAVPAFVAKLLAFEASDWLFSGFFGDHLFV